LINKQRNLISLITDTHSGPGGYHQYILYDVTVLGFQRITYDSLVLGITQAIVNAHINMQAGRIFISQAEVNNVSVNRSPYAYVNNPASERAQYPDSVDRTMTQLRFMNSANNQVLGALNFLASKFQMSDVMDGLY